MVTPRRRTINLAAQYPHTSGSHLIFYNPVSRRRAVVPQHNRDMPKGTLMSLLREAGFSREELIDFLGGN